MFAANLGLPTARSCLTPSSPGCFPLHLVSEHRKGRELTLSTSTSSNPAPTGSLEPDSVRTVFQVCLSSHSSPANCSHLLGHFALAREPAGSLYDTVHPLSRKVCSALHAGLSTTVPARSFLITVLLASILPVARVHRLAAHLSLSLSVPCGIQSLLRGIRPLFAKDHLIEGSMLRVRSLTVSPFALAFLCSLEATCDGYIAALVHRVGPAGLTGLLSSVCDLVLSILPLSWMRLGSICGRTLASSRRLSALSGLACELVVNSGPAMGASPPVVFCCVNSLPAEQVPMRAGFGASIICLDGLCGLGPVAGLTACRRLACQKRFKQPGRGPSAPLSTAAVGQGGRPPATCMETARVGDPSTPRG